MKIDKMLEAAILEFAEASYALGRSHKYSQEPERDRAAKATKQLMNLSLKYLSAIERVEEDPRWQKLRDLFALHGWHNDFWNGTPNPDQIVSHIGYIADERARLLVQSKASQAVAVKPLEWEGAGGDGKMSIRADAIGLRYYIYLNGDDGLWHAYTEGYQMENFGEHPTKELAQKAVQSGHERRILSALSQPHPADERVVEALRQLTYEHVCEKYGRDIAKALLDNGWKWPKGAPDFVEPAIFRAVTILSTQEGRKNG